MIDASTLSKTVAFGDSATDNGTYYDLTSQALFFGLPLDSLGYAQKHSDGEVHIDHVADALSGGVQDNYAISGAFAIGTYSLGTFLFQNGLLQYLKVPYSDPILQTDMNVTAQVDRYLTDTAGQDRSDDLAFINIGTNDYFAFTDWPEGSYFLINTLIMFGISGTIVTQARRLAEAGTGHIAITTMPEVHTRPNTNDMPPELADMYNFLAWIQNQIIRNAVDQLQDDGYDVMILENGVIHDEIVGDLTSFGFLAPLDDVAVITLPNGDKVFDPPEGLDLDQIAYYDELHASAALNGVIGAFEIASLTSNLLVLDQADNGFFGSAEADLVLARDGDDIGALLGGDDIAIAGLGNDTISGDAGRDLISGGSGNDVLNGGDDADVLAGNDGDDTLNGGLGGDVLIAGLGDDVLNGDAGDDVFLFREEALIGGDGSGVNEINGGADHDILYIAITDETRALFDGPGGLDIDGLITHLNLTLTGIEDIIVVDSRADLADVDTEARLDDADLWGMI